MSKLNDEYDEFSVKLNKAMGVHGYIFKTSQSAQLVYENINYENIHLVYDLIFPRLLLYKNNFYIEQFFFMEDDKKTFLEWLKNPIKKSVLDIAILKANVIVDTVVNA